MGRAGPSRRKRGHGKGGDRGGPHGAGGDLALSAGLGGVGGAGLGQALLAPEQGEGEQATNGQKKKKKESWLSKFKFWK